MGIQTESPPKKNVGHKKGSPDEKKQQQNPAVHEHLENSFPELGMPPIFVIKELSLEKPAGLQLKPSVEGEQVV